MCSLLSRLLSRFYDYSTVHVRFLFVCLFACSFFVVIRLLMCSYVPHFHLHPKLPVLVVRNREQVILSSFVLWFAQAARCVLP